METAGGGSRRRLLLDEKPDSASLRDFLRIKDSDGGDLHSLSGLTLSAVLGTEKPPPPPTRTLLEIIRNDPNYTKDSKKTWRAFKDKIRLRRAGNEWTSTVPIPASDIPIQNRMVSRRNSTRFQQNPYPDSNSINVVGGDENRIELNSVSSSNDRVMMLRRNLSRVPTISDSRYGPSGIDGSISFNGAVVVNEGGGDEEEEAEEREGGGEEEELGGGEVVEAPGRISLMALLAETDREMGLDGSGYMEEDEEEEEEESGGGGGGGGEYNCCVCMVRHKGSAFIPCGHTFCRLCSRELWVQRGNCPLCNGYILEILDIF